MERAFIDFSIEKLQQLSGRIHQCLERLTDDQIWMREADTQNAVGNLVLHLCGNVRQWIIAGIGGSQDVRQRDEEFAARGGTAATALNEKLKATVAEACRVLAALPPSRLAETVRIQNYERTVMVSIYHVGEHFSQNTGQIIFPTKLFTREDLGFYRHLQQAQAHAEKTP